MAIVNTKSAALQGLDASTRTLADGHVGCAPVWSMVGTLEVSALDDNNSVYRFVRIPSNARLESLQIASDAIDGGTDFRCGLYEPGDGPAVDANLFSEVDLSSGNNVPVDVLLGVGIGNIGKRVWELLGLEADPFTAYDVCLTGATVGTDGGAISMRVQHVI